MSHPGAAQENEPASAPGLGAPRGDLIDRLRAGFRIEDRHNPRIAEERAWYSKNKRFVVQSLERSKPFIYFILSEIDKRHLPAELALLPVIESGYQPMVVSPSGAGGIWQFVPGSARVWGLKMTPWYDGRRDIVASTHAALDYLAYLSKQFDGDWLKALAAYNGGARTIQEAIDLNRSRGRPTTYWDLSLREETFNFVPKLLAIVAIVENPEAHGVELPRIPDQAYFTETRSDDVVDLRRVAAATQQPLSEVVRLNPAYPRWRSDPAGPHRLLLPLQLAEKQRNAPADFLALDKSDTTEPPRSPASMTKQTPVKATALSAPTAAAAAAQIPLPAQHHVVQQGDSLWSISRRYQVKVADITRLNHISSKTTLVPGQKIMLTPAVDGAENSPPTKKSHTQHLYAVKAGDSLSAISKKFKVSVRALCAWNDGLTPATVLQPGQQLKVTGDI